MFGSKVAQMQGAGKFVTGATLKVVKITDFIATPQMGDLAFKHQIRTLQRLRIFLHSGEFTRGWAKFVLFCFLKSFIKSGSMVMNRYAVKYILGVQLGGLSLAAGTKMILG